MKKVLVFLLATLIAVSCILLVACNATVTELKIEGAPTEVKRGEEIDYSKINVVATYDDGNTETIAITDKKAGVNYTPIDTSTTGAKTLSARYRGKSAQVTITVKQGDVELENVIVTEFNNTDGYNAYLEAKKEQSNKQTEFYNRNEHYKVGTTNGYVFLPKVTVLDDNDEEVDLPEDQVKTTYELYTVDGKTDTKVENTATYLSKVENNIYYFTSQAVGVTFKLKVSLAEGFELIDEEMATTVEQVFTVVDGYNVYNALGLSVLDNLNNKSWAQLKSHKFEWDNDKTLAQFTDVSQVILHNDIKISTDQLPGNYFWTENEPALKEGGVSYSEAYSRLSADYKPYLKGSLKEIYLGEEWENNRDNNQRALYVSDGIGLSGNYLTVSYNANYNTEGKNGLYVVFDFNQTAPKDYPEGHWSVIGYKQPDDATNSALIENVYFTGETGKTEDNSNPAGLMIVTTQISTLTINNVIGTDWFCDLDLDKTDDGVANISNCKFYNSFSQMIYSWRTKEINITNCEMKDAGGPIMIIQTRTSSDRVCDTVVNIDSTDRMESWLSGAELWFAINNLPETDVKSLFNVATLTDSAVGTHYKDGEKVNLIAVVIPEPAKVFENQYAIKGTISVGSTTYGMENSTFETLATLATDIAEQGANLAGATLEAAEKLGEQALSAQEKGLVQQLQGGFNSLKTNQELNMLRVLPIYQCGDVHGMLSTSFTNLNDVKSGIAELYGGAKMVLAKFDNIIAYLQSLNQDTTDAEQLKAGWTAIVAKLAHVCELEIGSDWSTSWNAGHMAVWMNGGANTENPAASKLTVKHFMILIGEKKTVAA